MSQFTHKEQKYALIHSAAGEIKAHIDRLKVCEDEHVELHMLHIEKTALFIEFVEDIYIIPETQSITDEQIKDIWDYIQYPKYAYSTADMAPMWKPILIKMKEYQKKINGKFMAISPF